MKSVRGKIMIPVYIMAGIFILFMGLQISIVFTNLKLVRQMQNVYFKTTEKAQELKLGVVQVQQWLTDISATRAAEGYDDGYDEALNHANEIETIVQELKEINPSKQSQLDTILNNFKPYYETGKQMAQEYIDKGPAGGNLMMAEFDKVAEEINANVDAFREEASQDIEEAIADIEASIIKSVILAVAAGIIAVFLSLAVRVSINKRVMKPLREVRDVAGELAKGNLGVQISYNSEDEMGQLAAEMQSTTEVWNSYISDISRCMEEMGNGDLTAVLQEDFKGDFVGLQDSILHFKDKIHSVLLLINHSANQVSVSTEQVSDGAQQLAAGASEQAASVEELTGNIHTISEQSSQNASTADEAKQMSEDIRKEVSISNQEMQKMVAAMQDINQNSNQIGKIIKTIEDIAFQTNILALNAAVEAARAGEAGKGFAVVADEVRNLASKSADAANDTTVLIEQSIKSVQNGAAMADATAQSLQGVVEGVGDVAKVIHRISEESNYQAKAVSEIMIGIGQISSVVQTVSATAEESSSASEELSREAQMLKEQVEQFKI